MNRLAKVTEELPEDRGPDVSHPITVPQAWLSRGETIQVDIPRRLSCARCDGGGCDACERRGALTIRAAEEVGGAIRVRLSPSELGIAQLLRIPAEGAPSAEAGRSKGCLMLRVAPGPLSPGVRLLGVSSAEAGGPPLLSLKIWLWLPVLLLIVYLTITAIV